MTVPKGSIFYVYEHWRSDTGVCFYVGKGHGHRAYTRGKRNKIHRAIEAKLEREGHNLEVRILAEDLPESAAFELEIERIAHWKSQGEARANIALGGNGPSGFRLSEERCRQISAAKRGNTYRLGAKLSDETKAKIGAAHRGHKLSDEHKALLSDRLSGDRNPFFGRKHTPATGARVAEANRLRKWSDESRAKLSETLKRRIPKPRRIGWKLSEETKLRQSAGAKERWRKWKLANASR